MSDTVFLYAVKKNTSDRIAYINLDDIRANKTRIDGKFHIYGSNYSHSLDNRYKYDEIYTILSKEEFDILCNGSRSSLSNSKLNEIFTKLKSDENLLLRNYIIDEEIEWLKDEYALDDSDIDEIFSRYYRDPIDRDVVIGICDNIEELGFEMAEIISGGLNELIERYFDGEAYGEDLVTMDERYVRLRDERVVELNL